MTCESVNCTNINEKQVYDVKFQIFQKINMTWDFKRQRKGTKTNNMM